jgi:hypothetical protein
MYLSNENFGECISFWKLYFDKFVLNFFFFLFSCEAILPDVYMALKHYFGNTKTL